MFSSVGVAVLDVVRLVVFVGCFWYAGTLATRRDEPDVATRLRRVGLALALVVIGASRVTNLGAPLVWQLPVSVVVLALIGASDLSRYRRPQRK